MSRDFGLQSVHSEAAESYVLQYRTASGVLLLTIHMCFTMKGIHKDNGFEFLQDLHYASTQI